VPKKRGITGGEIIQRIVAAGSESDKYREYSDNEQKKCCQKWCLQMQQVEKKERRKLKLNHKLEALAQGLHSRDLKL